LSLYHRSWAQWDLGFLGQAWADMRESLDLSRQCDTPTQEVAALSGLGHFSFSLGQLTRSRGYCQQSQALSQKISFPAGEAGAIIDQALADVVLGDAAGGRVRLGELVRLCRGLGLRWQGESLIALAEACLYDWDLEPARALSQRALRLAERMDLRPLQVQSLGILGRALAGLGRFVEAESALRRALEMTTVVGYPMYRWRILLALANLLAEQGHPEASVERRTQARAVVEELLESLDREDLRQSFWERPSVRGLLGTTAVDPLPDGRVCLWLARLGAPTGRPLRQEEHVAVLWTAQLEPLPDENKVGRRRRYLLHLLSEARLQGGDPTEADLARVLGVSPRTVRTDVAALRQAGRCIRTRGARS
jgi:tetratricopeptide (TPR) repeat protein